MRVKPPRRASVFKAYQLKRTLTISIPADVAVQFYQAAKDAGVGPSTFAARCIAYAVDHLQSVTWVELIERKEYQDKLK